MYVYIDFKRVCVTRFLSFSMRRDVRVCVCELSETPQTRLRSITHTRQHNNTYTHDISGLHVRARERLHFYVSSIILYT